MLLQGIPGAVSCPCTTYSKFLLHMAINFLVFDLYEFSAVKDEVDSSQTHIYITLVLLVNAMESSGCV